MKFNILPLLALALAATFGAAESELAHAMEFIYMSSKYQTEGLVYTKDYWIAPKCADGINRRCTFNEFVSYLKYGNRQTGPAIIELNGQFNWGDRATLQNVATKMAAIPDPTDSSRQKLFMAGDMKAPNVIPQVSRITKLYEKLQEFDRLVFEGIARKPDGADKADAKASLDASNNLVLKAAMELRRATRNQKLHDELTAKFSPTGRFDKVYEYERDGKTLRFDPIQWSITKKTLWGRGFQEINLADTRAKNPQINDPILWQRLQDHVKLFDRDGEDGKGKGLVIYDPRYAGTNARHQNIINVQYGVGSAYGKSC